jgi:hypothetical protein
MLICFYIRPHEMESGEFCVRLIFLGSETHRYFPFSVVLFSDLHGLWPDMLTNSRLHVAGRDLLGYNPSPL